MSNSIWLCGLMFFGFVVFDSVEHAHNAMTPTYSFLALLSFVVAPSVRRIERRLAVIERSLKPSSSVHEQSVP
jgi:hypothetical protein